LTGTPAAPPAESPAPSAPLKTPPRRLRDDREEVSRIGRRANEELTKEIFEYRTRLFKGEPGYTTEGLRDLTLRRDHDDNETLYEIGDDGKIRTGDEIVPDVRPGASWIVDLPPLTKEQGEWNTSLIQPLINDLHDQGVEDRDVSATLKMLTGQPSVASAEEGAAALRKEMGNEKAVELGHIVNWFFDEKTGIVSPGITAWLESRGWLQDPGFLKKVAEHARPRLEAEQKAQAIMKDTKSAYWSLNDRERQAAVAEVNGLLRKARGGRELFKVR